MARIASANENYPAGSTLLYHQYDHFFKEKIFCRTVPLMNDEAVYRTAPATPGLLKRALNVGFETSVGSVNVKKNILCPCAL